MLWNLLKISKNKYFWNKKKCYAYCLQFWPLSVTRVRNSRGLKSTSIQIVLVLTGWCQESLSPEVFNKFNQRLYLSVVKRDNIQMHPLQVLSDDVLLLVSWQPVRLSDGLNSLLLSMCEDAAHKRVNLLTVLETCEQQHKSSVLPRPQRAIRQMAEDVLQVTRSEMFGHASLWLKTQ